MVITFARVSKASPTTSILETPSRAHPDISPTNREYALLSSCARNRKYINSTHQWVIMSKMKKIMIQLRPDETTTLEEILQKHGLEYSIGEGRNRFLPSPWREIIISLTPILIEILRDFLKNRKSKTKVIVKVDGTSFELEAENIHKLEILLEKNTRKMRAQQK